MSRTEEVRLFLWGGGRVGGIGKYVVYLWRNLTSAMKKCRVYLDNCCFDYTEWQRGLFDGMSVKELSSLAMKEYKKDGKSKDLRPAKHQLQTA